jgi:hypothetical protein
MVAIMSRVSEAPIPPTLAERGLKDDLITMLKPPHPKKKEKD